MAEVPLSNVFQLGLELQISQESLTVVNSLHERLLALEGRVATLQAENELLTAQLVDARRTSCANQLQMKNFAKHEDKINKIKKIINSDDNKKSKKTKREVPCATSPISEDNVEFPGQENGMSFLKTSKNSYDI